MSNKLSELNANSQVQADDLMYLVQENDDNELEGRKILAKNAIGQTIPYATWQNMTAEQKQAAGKVFVPDFPTATPNATEIPMSSSDNTSVAAALSKFYFLYTTATVSGDLTPTQVIKASAISSGILKAFIQPILIVNNSNANVYKAYIRKDNGNICAGENITAGNYAISAILYLE